MTTTGPSVGVPPGAGQPLLMTNPARVYRRRGAAATEAALVLPVLSLLLFGCVDFGRVVYAQIAMTNAVRVGAEYGATHHFTTVTQSNWEAHVRSTMLEEAASISSFVPESFTSTVNVSTLAADDVRIQIAATYPFRTVVSWPGFPSEITLRHEVTMRQYQ